MSKEIYCDWASTALFDTEILEKAFKTSIEFAGNPSSVHQKGIDAKNILQNARKRSAKALGVKEENIIFTSGGTESNHLPILSLLNNFPGICSTLYIKSSFFKLFSAIHFSTACSSVFPS